MEGERFRRFIGMGGGLDVFVIGRKRWTEAHEEEGFPDGEVLIEI